MLNGTCGIHPDALQSLTGTVEVPIAWSVLYPAVSNRRSQWPRVLWLGSAAARLLELWVRIPPGHGCLPLVFCQVESLRRADHLTRGISPSVVCPVSVIVKPLRGNHGPESGRSATGSKKSE